MNCTILEGDVLARLADLPDESVQTVVTSPPYWAMRDYGIPPTDWPEITFAPMPGLPEMTSPAITCCLGLETDPWAFVAHTVAVFREVRRVLKSDGTLWMNFGDSYASGYNSEGSMGVSANKRISQKTREAVIKSIRCTPPTGLKPKDLCGIPWRVAYALQADGWYLRSDIIWHKPNPMPESVNDRPTKSHEYLFLFSKNERYYYDIDAIREDASFNTHSRRSRAVMGQKSNPDEKKNGIRPYKVPDGWDTTKGEGCHGTIHREGRAKGPANYKGSIPGRKAGPGQYRRSTNDRKIAEPGSGIKSNTSYEEALSNLVERRNKRTVWTVASQPFKEAHFATFPPALIKPCILAGSRSGDTVLDPFFGSGTTGLVAQEFGRNCIGIELNPVYVAMAKRRIAAETPGLALS